MASGALLFRGDFEQTTFTDRDLARAADLTRHWPIDGAEIGDASGARVPGAMLALVMGAPQLVAPGGDAPYALQVGMFLAALLVVGRGLRGPLGPWVGLLAAALWATQTSQLETIRRLWNPGFLPLFVAGAIVSLGRIAAERDLRALPWLALAVSLGAQLHLSLSVLATAGLLVALLLLRPTGARAAVPRALAVAALAYAPFLVGDLLEGLPRLRAALGGPGGSVADSSRGAGVLDAVSQTLGFLTGLRREASAGTRMPPVRVVASVATTAVAGLAVAASLRRLPPKTAGARITAVLGLAAFLYLSGVATSGVTSVKPRYVATVAGPVAWLAAWGLVTLAAAGWRRHRALGVLATVTIVAMVGARTVSLATVLSVRGTVASYREQEAVVDALAARAGLDLAGVAGRLTWVELDRDGAPRRRFHLGPFVHRLEAAGRPWPGSLPGPCFLAVTGAEPALEAALGAPADLIRRVHGDRLEATDVRAAPLVGAWSVVDFDVTGGPCPTTTAQRYVETPTERSLRRLLDDGALPEDGGTVVVDGGWAVRRKAGPDELTPLLAWIAVDETPAGLVFTLHSAQHRGVADNGGTWYVPAVVAETGLRLDRDGAPPLDIPWSRGLVGLWGAATPLRSEPTPVPPGRWRVRWTGERAGLARPESWPPPEPFHPFAVPVGSLVVGPDGTLAEDPFGPP